MQKVNEIDISKLNPTNDYIFKRLFGRKGSEKITQGLIRNFIGIIGAEVKEVVEDKILERDIYTDKLAILDVQARTNNKEYINIEMQCGNYRFIKDRIVVYLCKAFGMEAVRAGESYGEVRKTIAVLICKEKLDILKDIPKWKTNWHIREDEYMTKVLTEKLEIVIIELEKISEMLKENNDKISSEIKAWHKFFLNPKKLGGKEMSENVDVKEAKEKYDELLTDYTEAKLALSRQMYIMDMNSAKKEGYEDGIEAGIEVGEKQKQIEIAKNLLKEKLSVEVIMRTTGLTKQEIEELK